MKTPFQRILPILKGVLVVCGILFVLQGVATFFLKEATTNRFQEINNEVARSHQLGQLDTLSQQLQHSNNHVTGVLSEEGGKGPSPTPADADAQGIPKQAQNVIIAVLAFLIVGLIGMAVVPPARGDCERSEAIQKCPARKDWIAGLLRRPAMTMCVSPKIVFIASTLLVFAAFNYGIYQKEQIKANGETVFLEIAPVDPRSLMQGDYMRLRYAIERNQQYQEKAKRGYMVVGLDQNKVGTFKRLYDGGELAADEKLLHYHNQDGQLRIVPDSFMFQEGHAKLYEQAKYGVFKFDNNGSHILVGLADDKMQAIQSNN